MIASTSKAVMAPVCVRPRVQARRTVAARATPTKVVAEAFAPPTVTDTKRAFLESYPQPVPALYNTVVQEILVQQHFTRYNIKYSYDKVFALGVKSAMDAILDQYEDADDLFTSYITSLDEKPETYLADAAELEAWAKEQSAVVPSADGDAVQKELAKIAANVEKGDFYYSKFFAIGLFRMLELTGAKDPKALEELVAAMGVPAKNVNKDLMLYKGILSKLSAAKDLFADFLERERKQQALREEEKAKKAAGTEEPKEETKEEPAKAEA